MKKPVFQLLAATAIIAIGLTLVQLKWTTTKETHSYQEKEEEEEGDELQSGAAMQLRGWFQAKAYPNPENLSAKYQKAWEEYKEIKKKTQNQHATRLTSASNWTQLGYSQNGSTRIGGRIVCMAIDPNNTNNLWVGSASGGIWRSTNAGTSWA
ncbi:MAG TPA: hypothetical protein PLO70_16620, partial [Chitinophagaceae bacterium]|nr:hypothetical protein [Chitinophagaceae bacterium]